MKTVHDKMHETIREQVLRRISGRAHQLGFAVALVSALINLIWIIIGTNAGWLDDSEQVGWFFGGTILAGIIGITAGVVYYTIVAWRDL